MDRSEAGSIAESVVAELRSAGYDELTRRLEGKVETREVTGPSGTDYQVEVQGMWEGGRPGPLLVIVGVDDGSLRGAFSPVNRSFTVTPDSPAEVDGR